METTILKGNIISAESPEALHITENGYLIAQDGIVKGVYQELPGDFAQVPVQDFGDALITQAFMDMHLHAPQYPMVGCGYNLTLLDWLNTYTFPTEALFSDEAYARRVFSQLAQELIQNGTTRVCIFSSLHRRATIILMEELEKAGLTGFAGKVNMDRNSPAELSETTEESERETRAWLEESVRFAHIKPIITPRFSPSCTDALMHFLGKTAQENNLPIQSHLSENTNEIAWVKQLFPDCTYYWQSYDKHGLWNEKTLMAHCVWSDENERAAMKKAGVTVVHCPASNTNLVSGAAPIRTMLNEGLKVVLGSDIAGGDSLSGFDMAADAIRVSKQRAVTDGLAPLRVSEAWYLAVSAGAPFFGDKPGFVEGAALNAMVITDSTLCAATLTPAERLERALYKREPDAIKAVWSNGKQVYKKS